MIIFLFQPMDSLEPASSMPSSSASPGISSDNYDDLTSAEDFSFPWKQREILTFDIPVHDSERAGLGVSVKGKTSTSRGMCFYFIGLFDLLKKYLLRSTIQHHVTSFSLFQASCFCVFFATYLIFACKTTKEKKIML